MKKIVCTLIVFACGQIAGTQQKMTEDSLMKIMGDEVCVDIGKKDAADFTAGNFQMKLGMMFIGTFQKHTDELTEIYGDDFMMNQEKLRGIGEKIGFTMGLGCKAFQDIIMNNPDLVMEAMDKKAASKNKTIPSENNIVTKPAEVKSIYGKVISYSAADISFYTINENGKTKKLYWLQKFDGDDELIANPKRNIGKPAGFKYNDIKVYSPVSKTYKTISVITAYNVQEVMEPIEQIEEIKN